MALPVSVFTGEEFHPEYWVKRITAAWQNAVNSIIETGRMLIEAKDHLRDESFHAMIIGRLPFTPRTAQRLMKIAGHPVLSDATHVSRLPPSWGTLYELTKLPSTILKAGLMDGTITPELERKDVAKLKPKSVPTDDDDPKPDDPTPELVPVV